VLARDLGYVEARSELWATEGVQNGYRLVLLTDGRTGYVQGSAVELVARASPPPSPQPDETAPPPPRDAI
jgi:hypothetical protein